MPADLASELAHQLAGLLDAIAAGELTASPAVRHRIEGAVIALEILAGATPEELSARLVSPTTDDPTDTK